MSGVVESVVRAKLQTALTPTHLEVINESASHNVPPGSESHFKLVVVSECFAGMPRRRAYLLDQRANEWPRVAPSELPCSIGHAPLERHRLVNTALADELAG